MKTLRLASNARLQATVSGVFSYGKSQIPDIARYIENQQTHHEKRKFMDDYIAFLQLFEIDYDERYIYKAID